MFKRNAVNSAALICLGAVAAAPALAQETLERVEITGSRIKTVGAVSASPITSVGSEEIKASQSVAVEEIIRGMPAATPAIGPGVNNGSGGGATLDLRGLGPSRSLVLIDGRRLVPFNLNGQVDTNSVPVALLQRIDIVTGGASAVYGADAVAGVVNFVLKKNFQGIELASSYGVSERGDSIRRRSDLTIGGNFADGKGNAVLSIGTTKTDPLIVGDRDIGKTTTSSATGKFTGSDTTVPLVISVAQAAGIPAGSNTLGTGNKQLNPTTGRFEAYDPAVGSFNTNPPNYFQTPLDRRQLTGLASYSINEHAEAYAQVFYTRSVVNSVLAASGTFGNTFQVPIGNPYIPEAARQQICSARGIAAVNCVAGNNTLVPMTLSRRFTELGPRYNDFENKTLQTTVGMRGDLIGSWTYDAYLTSGEADQTQIRRNWGSFSKLSQSLNALSTTACTNTANGCVPLNVWGAEGSITPAMLNFINLSSLLLQKVRQQVTAVSTSGDLGDIKSPWSKAPIGLAFGAEERKVTASTQSDGASQTQSEVLGTGAPTPDRRGTFTLKEFYGEAQVPLLQNLPFARSVTAELGYRETRFTTSTSNSYNSNKYGLDWEPVKGLRFRGMMQNATRAPNVNELFAPQVTGLSNLATDPCQGANINAGQANTAGTLSNLCVLTGVPASVVGSLPAPSSGQINVLSGGNPNLGPEKAKTKTIGFVYEPSFVKNLLVSLDYYQIELTGAIASPSTTDILDQCYKTQYNPGLTLNAACSAIYRSASTGTFNGADSKGVLVVSSNQGKRWTSGYDLTIGYGLAAKDLGLSPAMGRLDLSLNLNQVMDNDRQATPTSVRRLCRGYYSNACGEGNNGLRFSQRTTWTAGDFTAGYNWRHLSAMNVEPGSGTWFADFTKVKAYDYFDVNASWAVNKMLKLTLTINNITDKTPPTVGNTIATTGGVSGNTMPSVYDPIGRFYTIGATLKF